MWNELLPAKITIFTVNTVVIQPFQPRPREELASTGLSMVEARAIPKALAIER